MIYNFPAIIKYEPQDSVYYVDFPDISSCFTDGRTLREALDNAEDALNTMLSYIEEKTYPIPQPSNIKDINAGVNEIVTIIKTNTAEAKIAV